MLFGTSCFEKHLSVHTVFFNGQKSEELFRKLVRGRLKKQGLEFVRLPSTSPAHASLTRAQKIEKWKRVLLALRME